MNSILLYLIWITSQSADHPNATIPINILSDKSEYIVNTKLISIDKIQKDSQFYAIANLEVLEAIKGDMKDTIEVVFDPRETYPPNPEFYQYASNIAFLNKEGSKYKVFGSSKGVKQFHHSERAVEYSERIKAYLDIMAEEIIDSTKIVNWIIDNFKYQSTAEEAIEFLGQSLTNEECYKTGTATESSLVYNRHVFVISRLLSEQNKQDVRTAFVDGKVKDNSYSYKVLNAIYNPKDQKYKSYILSYSRDCVKFKFKRGAWKIVQRIHEPSQNEVLDEIYDALLKMPNLHKHNEESIALLDQYLTILGH